MRGEFLHVKQRKGCYMLEIVGIPESLPAIALLPAASALDFSCLDDRVTSHPMFVSGYRCGHGVYFDVESADPGDIVYGVPVTRISVIESICQTTLGTNYHGTSDLFFWSVGACAGFLAALAQYHWKEAQAGLVVLASLTCMILLEVLGC
jgi:hypothetical protein